MGIPGEKPHLRYFQLITETAEICSENIFTTSRSAKTMKIENIFPDANVETKLEIAFQRQIDLFANRILN